MRVLSFGDEVPLKNSTVLLLESIADFFGVQQYFVAYERFASLEKLLQGVFQFWYRKKREILWVYKRGIASSNSNTFSIAEMSCFYYTYLGKSIAADRFYFVEVHVDIFF